MSTPTESGQQRILVIAGEHKEALAWARTTPDVNPSDWVYVHNTTLLRGRRYSPYVLIGTYSSRKDWPEIRDYLTIIQAVPYPVA